MNIWMYERVMAGYAGRKIVRSVPLKPWGIRRDKGEFSGEVIPVKSLNPCKSRCYMRHMAEGTGPESNLLWQDYLLLRSASPTSAQSQHGYPVP